MAIQIKHAFISLKGDGTDATQVQPSNWNALHSTSMASGNVLGRLSAGSGAFEEIPISSYMAGLLASADAAALASALGLSETGDIKYTFKTTASPGWVLILGGTGTPGNTIGNAASGAVSRANADTQALFILLYNACNDTIAPVSGGRSGNALNDFNANKTIRVPNLVGRSPIGAGSATNDGTVARVLGTLYGAETMTIGTSNLPPYTPSGTVNPGSLNIGWINDQMQPPGGGAKNAMVSLVNSGAHGSLAATNFVGWSWTGNPQGGSSQPTNNLHPVVALNVMVKL